MASYLLDSNHASPLVTLHHPLRKQILGSLQDGNTFFICVPVLSETVFGLSLLPRAAQNLAEWTAIRTKAPCLIVDEDDAYFAAQLQVGLRQRGWRLETVDALIASIALRYDLVLLTIDKDFSAIPDLKRENWLV